MSDNLLGFRFRSICPFSGIPQPFLGPTVSDPVNPRQTPHSTASSKASGRFLFPKWANFLLPIILVSLAVGAPIAVTTGLFGLSAETLATGYQPNQPVPYSHEKHLRMGLDCYTCHNTADKSNFASIPSAEVCIRCHGPKKDAQGNEIKGTEQVHSNSPFLKPLHAAWNSGKPVRWTKVHDLPDYAYFSHASHVNRGVGCASCHGRVDKMGGTQTADPVAGVTQVKNLSMGWCIECHREPEKNLRPLDQITNMQWQALDAKNLPAFAKVEGLAAATTEAEAQAALGAHLKGQYGIRSKQYMQSCSTCHR